MRGAPHSGFSALIRRISAHRSASIFGRPPRDRDFQRQYRRKPPRCQRTRVSGRMIVMVFRTDGNHRYSWTKNKRSPFLRWTRPRIFCRNTISWCRSAAFSASSWLFDLNGEVNRVRKKQSNAIIAVDVRRFGHVINKNEVFGTHSYPGEHEAIIDETIWDKVQAILSENRVDRANGKSDNEP